MKDQIKLRLILDVEYDLNGESQSYLEKNLLRLVQIAAGDGLLTSSSDAEVSSYRAKVEVIP